jgi:hypothetical protein
MGLPVSLDYFMWSVWLGLLMVQPKHLLIMTALIEARTGLLLLVLPSVPIALLLGVEHSAPETILVARVTGAALLAFGVASWFAPNDQDRRARLGLLTAILIYDLAAAALLAYAGLVLSMAGLVLWPAVVIHAALAICCVLIVWGKQREGVFSN